VLFRSNLRLVCHDDRVEGLILWQLDGGLGRFTPSNVNQARLTGCGAHYERRWGEWSLRTGLDWQDARDGQTDQALPWRSPRRLILGLEKRTGAWEWRGDLTAAATRYNDAANTDRLPGYALVNLTAAWKPAPDWRIEARLANALDSHYTLVRGYNTPERNLFLTLRYQPR
jgi:vitamin B12 transporter